VLPADEGRGPADGDSDLADGDKGPPGGVRRGDGGGGPADNGGGQAVAGPPPDGSARKPVLLRLSVPVYDAVARWARDDLRSVTAQVEFLLRQSLAAAGRSPTNPGPLPRRGRPPAGADNTKPV
jgi:hypothetical protein